MDNLKKYEKCIHAFYIVRDGNRVTTCVPHAKTLGKMCELAEEIDPSQCEHCEHYKSRCIIEYPITVNSIKVDELKPKPKHIEFTPVRVRPFSDEKIYFGILLGNFPYNSCTEYNEETKELKVHYMDNPCILIPELKHVVFGDECWWEKINESEISPVYRRFLLHASEISGIS